MPTEAQQPGVGYFETPERSERLQLIIHLLHNAEDVPYLRGPSGAGKTRFAAHLVDKTPDDFSVVWINATQVDDLRKAVAAEFGLDDQALAWPGEVIEADNLALQQIAELFELHEAGGRLLFLGAGGLSHLQGDWDLQFVDLPPFTEEQSIAFLNSRQQTEGAMLDENVARSLHRAAGGLPGQLLNALSATPQAAAQKPVGVPAAKRGGLSGSMLLLAGGAVLALALVLFFQDDINNLFEPPADSFEATSEVVTEEPVESLEQETAEVPAQPAEPVESVARIEREVEAEAEAAAEAVEASPPTDLPADVDGSSPQMAVASETPQSADSVADPAPVESAEAPDPVLDAVIEAAIAAAAQPPEPAAEPIQEAGPEKAAAEKAPPVAEVQAPAPIKATQPEPEPEKAKLPAQPPPVAVAAETAGAGEDEAWLKAQAPGDYTLQLVGARDTGAIAKFIARHNIQPPFAVFQRDLNGQPWFSLVAGVYPDRDAAVAARSRLAPPLNGSGVWPRTFASITEQLSNKP